MLPTLTNPMRITLAALASLLLTACANNDNRISGTALTPSADPLPDDAVLEIRIDDTSLADAKAQTLTSFRIEAPQSTENFSLSVPEEAVDPRHQYSVSARITQDDQLLFITDRHYPVLTGGQNRNLKLELIRVKQAPPAELVPTRWQLSELDGKPVAALERPPYLQLNADEGRVNGHSGCNAFAGSATLGTPSLQFGPLLGTRMMCDDATMAVEDRMLQLLERVSRWKITASQLRLLDDQGQTLMQFTANGTPG